ncbi:MAG: hypothetical protein XD60_1673 [Acetothermia bacterium 64_32]|nr:MAG: hypothetical protein XD60_1673 [Acetothermia bacterium 64_32]
MRRFLPLLLGVLVFGPAGIAAEAQQSAEVFWSIEGCWITLEVHDDVDLGTVSGPWEPGEYIEDTDGNRIEIVTNCEDWVLEVSRDWAPPSGYSGDGLEDFYIWFVDHGGDDHSIANGWDDPNNGEGDIAKGLPGTHWFDMGYRYVLDYDDIPGTYTVTLTYTVTAP